MLRLKLIHVSKRRPMGLINTDQLRLGHGYVIASVFVGCDYISMPNFNDDLTKPTNYLFISNFCIQDCSTKMNRHIFRCKYICHANVLTSRDMPCSVLWRFILFPVVRYAWAPINHAQITRSHLNWWRALLWRAPWLSTMWFRSCCKRSILG